MSSPWDDSKGTIGPPAGWLSDPSDHSLERYWDGSNWSEFRRPRTEVSPLGAGHSVLGTHRVVSPEYQASSRAAFSQGGFGNPASSEPAAGTTQKHKSMFRRFGSWVLMWIGIIVVGLILFVAALATGVDVKDENGECTRGSGRVGIVIRFLCQAQKDAESHPPTRP